jgi:hypothetical protein
MRFRLTEISLKQALKALAVSCFVIGDTENRPKKTPQNPTVEPFLKAETINI